VVIQKLTTGLLGDEASPAQPAVDETAARGQRLDRDRRRYHVVKMTKPGLRPITLPHDKGAGGYPIGLTLAIMRQAGLKGGDE
jgi:hypothetical protein